MKDIRKILFIDKHTHERIIGRHLFKECSNRNYLAHKGHSIIYGSHARPVLSTYIPEGTVAKLLLQNQKLYNIIDNSNNQAMKKEANKALDKYNFNSSIFNPSYVDETPTNDYERERKQVIHQKKHRYTALNEKAQRNPQVIEVHNWDDAYRIITTKIIIQLVSMKYKNLIDVESLTPLSKTESVEWLTIYDMIVHKGMLAIGLDYRHYLCNKIGCSISTASVGIKRAENAMYYQSPKSKYVFDDRQVWIKYDKYAIRSYINVLSYPIGKRNPQGFMFIKQ